MSSGEPLVADAGERLRVASRAPVDVYAPTVDGPRFVSDHTGNYWPFRWTTHERARADQSAVERTVDRCETFRLDLGPGDPHVGPQDLYRAADDIGADEVVPRPLSTGIYQIEELATDYRQYDFRQATRLLLPVGLPHASISRQVVAELSDEADVTVPPDICLLGLAHAPVDEVVVEARGLRREVTGDIGIHIVGVTPSIELAAAVRREPNLFESIAFSPEASDGIEVEDTTGLSRVGRRDLGHDPDPAVALAADFSLLCSDYVDDDGLFKAGYDSVVPRYSV